MKSVKDIEYIPGHQWMFGGYVYHSRREAIKHVRAHNRAMRAWTKGKPGAEDMKQDIEKKDQVKTIRIIAGTIHLAILNSPPEIAIRELETIGVKPHSVAKNRTEAMITDQDAITKAKELIANGWEWEE